MLIIGDFIASDASGVLVFNEAAALAAGFNQLECDDIEAELAGGDQAAATSAFNKAAQRIEKSGTTAASYKFVQVGATIAGWQESTSVFARLLTSQPRASANDTFEYEVELSDGSKPRVTMTRKQHTTFGANISTGEIVTCIPRQGKKDVTSRELTVLEYTALKPADKAAADKAQKGLNGRPLVYLLGDTKMTYRFGGKVTGESLESAKKQFNGAADALTQALSMKLTMGAAVEALSGSAKMIAAMSAEGVDASIIASVLGSLIAQGKK